MIEKRLSPFYIFVFNMIFLLFFMENKSLSLWNSNNTEIILDRDQTFDSFTPINSEFYITVLERVCRSMCVQLCLLYSPECVSLLFDNSSRSCRLLRVWLNENIVDLQSNMVVTDEWEYWANFQACEAGRVAFGSHCYYLSQMEATLDNARTFCYQNDSYLIEMNSALENSWITDTFLLPVNGVKDQCPKFYSCSVWIGATTRTSPRKFVWSHGGKEMVYPEWAKNQPNNVGGNQDCVVLMRGGKANDRECDEKSQFICEKE